MKSPMIAENIVYQRRTDVRDEQGYTHSVLVEHSVKPDGMSGSFIVSVQCLGHLVRRLAYEWSDDESLIEARRTANLLEMRFFRDHLDPLAAAGVIDGGLDSPIREPSGSDDVN